MACDTLLWRRRVGDHPASVQFASFFMTRCALNVAMAAVQPETGRGVIERRRLPLCRVVAGRAIAPGKPCELSGVFVFVASCARFCSTGEGNVFSGADLLGLVTAGARYSLMRPEKRELRRRVIERLDSLP